MQYLPARMLLRFPRIANCIIARQASKKFLEIISFGTGEFRSLLPLACLLIGLLEFTFFVVTFVLGKPTQWTILTCVLLTPQALLSIPAVARWTGMGLASKTHTGLIEKMSANASCADYSMHRHWRDPILLVEIEMAYLLLHPEGRARLSLNDMQATTSVSSAKPRPVSRL